MAWGTLAKCFFIVMIVGGMTFLADGGQAKAAQGGIDITASSLMEGQRQAYQSHLTNSLLFMDREFLKFGEQDDFYPASHIAFAPGSDESQMNFSWYAPSTSRPGQVQVTKVSSGTEKFLETGAVTVDAKLKNATYGYSAHEATITQLENESDYMYRLGDGRGNWTDGFHFQTQNPESYEFLMIADPQIGASGDIEEDQRGWGKTLRQAVSRTPNSSFILSAGDQVDARYSENEYAAYFAPEPLRNYPTATTIGNHDNTHHYSYHFNVPNENWELGNYDNSGGNYYFSYGDTLFMNLNSNSMKPEEHIQFMEETAEATADREWKWKILVFHHSIYSAAAHSQSQFVLELREHLVPTIDAIGFDAVLMGHDHSYVRTYQMRNFQALKNHMMQGDTPVNPEGTLYITGSTASGSKFYGMHTEREPYSAVRAQWGVPTYMSISVEPERLSLETYRTDTEELVDEYEIIKDPSIETIVPALEEVELITSNTVLATEENSFYPEVELKVKGQNVEGGQYDISPESITFRTSRDDVQIKDGSVQAAKDAQIGIVEVYAEVADGEEIWDSNVIELELVKHDEVSLLEGGSEWRYLDDGSDQKTEWRSTEFDAGDWEQGAGPLGFPEDEERPEFGAIETLVGYGSDETDKIALTYFRTEFDVEDAKEIGDLGYVEFGVDDAVILYLNGEEIMRFNMPETGEFGFGDYQRAVMEEYYGDESRIERIYLDETALSHVQDGRNVLAAQVHQDDRFSSDLYWDMEFVANTK
ncbi:metallophosphoesterase family protein [Planococcus sp. ISL-109]|uniref:purple acid phosphatase family protein n=1 Tax=Planococcus sp. ISL-109 TaxID=2819166 RepID=UPI001BEAAC95|nr:metallophosphoesterase family protein [Planococcus sp. ISL-109]MBT2582727.1 metallophosphoesterase family protein [Planococcus sp. ISL-109]